MLMHVMQSNEDSVLERLLTIDPGRRTMAATRRYAEMIELAKITKQIDHLIDIIRGSCAQD